MTEKEINDLSGHASANIGCLPHIMETLQKILTLLENNNDNIPKFVGLSTEQKKRWKNANNSIPSKGDVNTMPSMTIPDQSLSIPEIMNRYARGLPLGGTQVPEYDEDPENPMPDLSKMDLVDQFAHLNAAKEEIKDIAHKYKTDQDKKKQDLYESYKTKYEELDKKYNDEKKAGEPSLTKPKKDTKGDASPF